MLYRNIRHRKQLDFASDLGVGIIVQSMVYGNVSIRSGTGVAFSRNPGTGENEMFGEFLCRGEGDDVVFADNALPIEVC
jgi:pyruvate,orthophosphate dikinase